MCTGLHPIAQIQAPNVNVKAMDLVRSFLFLLMVTGPAFLTSVTWIPYTKEKFPDNSVNRRVVFTNCKVAGLQLMSRAVVNWLAQKQKLEVVPMLAALLRKSC